MIKIVMRKANSNPDLFVIDEEPRNDDTEQRQIVIEYVSAIPRNGINLDERRDDW